MVTRRHVGCACLAVRGSPCNTPHHPTHPLHMLYRHRLFDFQPEKNPDQYDFLQESNIRFDNSGGRKVVHERNRFEPLASCCRCKFQLKFLLHIHNFKLTKDWFTSFYKNSDCVAHVCNNILACIIYYIQFII